MTQTTTGCPHFAIAFALIMFALAGLSAGRHFGYEQGKSSVVISLNPVEDFGAVCDMKTDDTKEFMLAGKLAAKLGGRVEVPDNCVVRDIFLKTGSGTFIGKDYRP